MLLMLLLMLLAAAEEFGCQGVGRIDMWLHGGSGDMVVIMIVLILVLLILLLMLLLILLLILPCAAQRLTGLHRLWKQLLNSPT